MNVEERKSSYSLFVEDTSSHCPAGEKFAKYKIAAGDLPVISCEGSCIRGEIARLAANMLSKKEGYGRACHGEILTVKHSAMAEWAEKAEKLIVIDGCFLHCHGRILKNMYNENKLAVYDALAFYKKFNDLMDIDDVPEEERKATAKLVADKIYTMLVTGTLSSNETTPCGCSTEETSGCGGELNN